MCLSCLFKELWPFENCKMYRNVLEIHFLNGQNSLENASMSLRFGIHQSKSGVKNFSLYWWGGGAKKSCSTWAETCFAFGIFEIRDNFWDAMNFVSEMKRWRVRWRDENFFFWSEYTSIQIWCQKFFPLLWGGGGPKKKLLNMSWNMFCFWNFLRSETIFEMRWILLVRWRDEEWDEEMKIFFLVRIYVNPKNLVSKNFSLYWGGGPKKRLLNMSWNMFCFWNFWDPRQFLRCDEFC